MSSTCPRCGAQVQPNDAFCPACGNALTPVTGGTVAMPVAQPQAFVPLPTATGKQGKRPWYKKKRFMIPLTLLIIFGMVGAAGAYLINQKYGDFQSISTPEPESEAAKALAEPTAEVTPTTDGSITILMMGVDAREGEAIDIGVRPDSLGVLHIDPETKTCRTLSIPRDTRVELPGYGQSKINHALSVGGIQYQRLVVQNTLGIKIDHFALVDFAGVVGVVDALGGVDVVNDTAFTVGDMDFPVGELHLNGEQALAYSRFRYNDEGDFGRQDRQQEVIKAMLAKADSLDAARAIPSTLNSIEGHFKTDLSITDLISMVSKYRDYCTVSSVETAGIDGTISTEYDELMKQDLSFVLVEQSEIDAKVRWLLGE